MQMSRRTILTSALGLGALALAGAGCANQNPDAATPAAEVKGGASFPAAVAHKFGTTTVPAAPQRVVSVGITEQDTLLAFGVVPLAVTEWYGKQPLATWEWARSRYGTAQPLVLSTADGFEYEKIAQLQPDLIVGTNSGMDEKAYQQLSALAPTIANSGKYSSDYFEPWDVQTRMIGEALGKKAEAETMITGLKGRFAAAAAANPTFAGKKVIFSQGGFYEGSAISSQDGLGTSFLTDLGFTVPKEIDQYSKDGNQAYIPIEKLDVMNTADVLVWATDDAAAVKERLANPVYQKLTAVKAGRSVETGELLAAAIYFSTVLSLPYVIDNLVPKLADALA